MALPDHAARASGTVAVETAGDAESAVTAETDPCPACGYRGARILFAGSDRLYRTTDREFEVIECAGCRLLRLFPCPPPAELHQYYPADYWFVPERDAASRLEELYRRAVLTDHVRFAAKALERTGKEGLLLDVGCGGGLFLRMMAERGHRVMGLDFSLSAAAAAWGFHGVPAVCASLTHVPVAPGSCAAVTMFHVLEHLYDPAGYLQGAHELLRDDGRLIVQVPNAASWQALLLGGNWNGLDIPRHLFDFRARDIEILLDRCGFEVVRSKYFSLRDNPAGLASSLAPGLDPMARRVRRIAETPGGKLLRDLVYFGMVVAALPFTLLEAACRAGSTVMVEARKRS